MFLMLTISCDKDEPETEAVTDIDGNVYKTVIIGTQVWMAENLKTTKYRDGSAIPNVIDSTEWANFSTGAYCNYENNANNSTTYGRLYNWYAVSDSRNIAPTGWHVPTDAEWTELTDYLGGESVAAGKLKETGLTHWLEPNEGATNATGFTALPAGYRYFNGTFANVGSYGYWWSATEDYNSTNRVYYRYMRFNNSTLDVGKYVKELGYSVRCVKD